MGFPKSLPSNTERTATGSERDGGAFEKIGGVANLNLSSRINHRWLIYVRCDQDKEVYLLVSS
jgi:hypothetical protein